MTRGFTLLLLTALVGLTLGVLPASAHSRLISISPKDGASLPGSPTEVVLRFNEPVNPQFVTVRVTDAEGGDVVGQDAAVSESTVTLPITDPIAAGTYNIVYRVVSADSHPISGSTSFTIEGDPLAPPASASPSTTPSPEASSTATPSASPAPTASPAASANVSADEATSSSDGSGGTPWWVWLVVFAAAGAAIAGTFYAVRRAQSRS